MSVQYNTKQLNVGMKRARSALSLKNMATSIQRSIQQHAAKPSTYHPLPSARSEARLATIESSAHKGDGREKMNKDQKENRIFILEKQIAAMERELDCSKSTIRTYSKELADYEKTTAGIQELEKQIDKQKKEVQKLMNQIGMLREEVSSCTFNAQQRVAEKQYFEQLIETYQQQYCSESRQVIQLVQLEEKGRRLVEAVGTGEEEMRLAAEALNNWKEETGFSLSQHKLKHSLKQARVELIQFQDECDSYCSQNGLRKVRQLCCLFFKSHARRNGVGFEQAEGGIDLFLCREQLVDEFSQFVRDRLFHSNRGQFQALEQYLGGLAKIEVIFRTNGLQAQDNLHQIQLEQIKQTQERVDQQRAEIVLNEAAKKAVRERIDKQFGEDSLAVIQYLRERNKNKYDIKEIKLKLKENKKEQDVRIGRVREAFNQVKHIEGVIARDQWTSLQTINHRQITNLKDEVAECEERMVKLELKMGQLTKDKDTIQNLISNAISKWRERDQNKARLKQLYQELADTKQSEGFIVTKNLSESLGRGEAARRSEYPMAESIRSKGGKKEGTNCMNESKNVLSLSNPYKKIMQREVALHQPILSDCQMILSRKLNAREAPSPFRPKQDAILTTGDLEGSFALREQTQNIYLKKTSRPQTIRSSKQNLIPIGKTKSLTLTQTKYSLSVKPSIPPSSNGKGKGKMSDSQRLSLSKLLISRLHR